MKLSIVKYLASAMLFSLCFFLTPQASLAQNKGGLKKVEKQSQNTQQDKKVIDAGDKKERDEAQANATKKGNLGDDFKKKKSGLDKAKSKLRQLEQKFKGKKESGKWTQEKYDRMMGKLSKKYDQLEVKKQELIRNLTN